MAVCGRRGDEEGNMTGHLGTTLKSKALQSWMDAYSVGWLETETQTQGARAKIWIFISSCNWPLVLDPESQQHHQDTSSLDRQYCLMVRHRLHLNPGLTLMSGVTLASYLTSLCFNFLFCKMGLKQHYLIGLQ